MAYCPINHPNFSSLMGKEAQSSTGIPRRPTSVVRSSANKWTLFDIFTINFFTRNALKFLLQLTRYKAKMNARDQLALATLEVLWALIYLQSSHISGGNFLVMVFVSGTHGTDFQMHTS